MYTITEISLKLLDAGYILKPVNNLEIIKLESVFNVSLPRVYKEFLLVMGNGAGPFMQGSSVFYDEIFFLKKWTNELLIDNGMRVLPDNAFVFWMHQGYQSAFFKIDEGEDPPVYLFSEGQEKNEFYLKENNLSDFFFKQLLFL